MHLPHHHTEISQHFPPQDLAKKHYGPDAVWFGRFALDTWGGNSLWVSTWLRCIVIRKYIQGSYKINSGVNNQKMSSQITFSTFEIISVILHLLTLIIVTLQCINTHTGDCRGIVLSTKQNPDGYCVTRQAKLSMHEIPHKVVHELQPI